MREQKNSICGYRHRYLAQPSGSELSVPDTRSGYRKNWSRGMSCSSRLGVAIIRKKGMCFGSQTMRPVHRRRSRISSAGRDTAGRDGIEADGAGALDAGSIRINRQRRALRTGPSVSGAGAPEEKAAACAYCFEGEGHRAAGSIPTETSGRPRTASGGR